MYGLGFWQMLVILFIFLVLFGPKRLPDLGDSLGRAIRNFRRSLQGRDEKGETPSLPAGEERRDSDPS